MSFDPGQDSTLRERAERFVRSWGVRIGGAGSFLNSLVFNFVETILLKRVLYNILQNIKHKFTLICQNYAQKHPKMAKKPPKPPKTPKNTPKNPPKSAQNPQGGVPPGPLIIRQIGVIWTRVENVSALTCHPPLKKGPFLPLFGTPPPPLTTPFLAPPDPPFSSPRRRELALLYPQSMVSRS